MKHGKVSVVTKVLVVTSVAKVVLSGLDQRKIQGNNLVLFAEISRFPDAVFCLPNG